MTTLQTGTKVLIEATVEMTDGKDDTTLVRFKTSGCYWMDTSDLTVCETAEVATPNMQQIEVGDVVSEVKQKLIDYFSNKTDFNFPMIGVNSVMKIVEPYLTEPVPTPSFKAGQEVEWKPEPGMRITLCGSTKFKQQFEEANRHLSLKGCIVYSVSQYTHAESIEITKEEKQVLADNHKRKIDLSDGIYVINVGGYIGESTKSEIDYAIKSGKFVQYLIRPIPAQPTVESELLDELTTYLFDKGHRINKPLVSDILAWHQKHSGMVEVSVPSDEEILQYWSKQSKDLSVRDAAIDLVRHFMTRKEAEG